MMVSAVAATASTPFFLLAMYLVRIGTIPRRTPTIGQFVLRESKQSAGIDGEGNS